MIRRVSLIAPETPTVASLRAGDDVDGVFACSRKDRLTARSGSAYLALELRDRTGTIVMLSICIAPLGLLTLAIGVARYLAGTAALREERGNEGTGEETSENA